MFQKLKEKFNLKAKFYKFAAGLLLAVVLLTLIPNQTSAADFNFSKLYFTNSIDVALTPNGPWQNSNFIRVGNEPGKSKFYVKMTVSLQSAQDTGGSSPNQLIINQDKIHINHWYSADKTIVGLGGNLVSKSYPAYYEQEMKAGRTPEVPCYVADVASSASVVTKVVVVAGVATIAVLAAPAVAGALGIGAAAGTGAVALTPTAIAGVTFGTVSATGAIPVSGAGLAAAVAAGAPTGFAWSALVAANGLPLSLVPVASTGAAAAGGLGAAALGGTTVTLGGVASGVGKAALVTAGAVGAWNALPDDQYVKCDSPVPPQSQRSLLGVGIGSPQAYQIGSAFPLSGSGSNQDNVFEVPQAQFKNLGMNGDPAAVDEFYAFPSVWVNLAGRDNDYATVVGAGKSIYVQIYKTDAEAAQHVNDPIPNGIPANGSATGSGKDVGGAGSPILGLINQIIGAILGIVSELLYLIFYSLIAPMIQAMLSIRTYTDTFVGVIYPAWIIIRNVCNIAFIVAIIAIAMGTLFRVEAYQYKHLLIQLIIAALLVNFSLVIAQAVLGIADTMQNQFLPNSTGVIRSLAKGMMLDYRKSVYTMDFSNQGYFTNTVKPLFLLSLSLGTFAVFLALAAFLVVRIVFLWILLMVSPVAYVAGILPITEEYRKMWWKEFIHYAFFTPVMAFLLSIAAVIYNQQQTNPVLQRIMAVSPADLGGTSFAAFVVAVSSNLILLVFLFAALNVANKFSIAGGDIAAKWGKNALLAPFAGAQFLAGKGTGYLGRKWNENTVKILGEQDKIPTWRRFAYAAINPTAFWKMMGERGKKLTEAAHHKAEAGGLMAAEQIMTRGHKVIPRIQQHAKAEADEFVKDYSQMSREKQVQVLKEVAQMGKSEEAKAMKRAITTAMMSRGFVDDAVQDGTRTLDSDGNTASVGDTELFKKMQNNHKFKIVAPQWDAATKKGIDNEHWYTDSRDGQYKMKYDDHTMAALMEALYGDEDQEAMRMLAEEGEKYGKDTFHSEYMRIAHFDLASGHYKWSLGMGESSRGANDGKQGKEFAASEISKMDARQQAKVVYHALMGLTNTGEIDAALLSKVEKALREMPAFQQERNPDQIIFGRDMSGGTDQKNNFNPTDGSIKVDPSTFRRLTNLTHNLKKPEVFASIYLKATGGSLTNGKVTSESITGFVKEMKKIQDPTFQASYAAAAARGGTALETFVKDEFKTIDNEKVDKLITNGGLRVEVHNPDDRDFSRPSLPTVNDIGGHTGYAAGSAVPVNRITLE